MNVLLNRIDAQKLFAIQNYQYQEGLYFADTVPALGTKMNKVSVSNLGHFYCRHICMNYTTADTVGGVATDTGIDYLRGQLVDGGKSLQMFNDFVPFGLWGVPGRRKSLTTSGSDSFQQQVIFPWEYVFSMNSDIQLNVKNDALLQPNSYSILFIGVRIKASQN